VTDIGAIASSLVYWLTGAQKPPFSLGVNIAG